MRKKLLDAFHIEKKQMIPIENDFLVFQDKALLEEIRIKVLENLSNQGAEKNHVSFEVIEQEVLDVTYNYHLTSGEKNYIYHVIDSEVNGYGPLTELLKDVNITEIMVNNPKDIYIEIDGFLKRDESVSFINDAHILRTIEKLLEPSGKIIDVHHPIVDAILEDGSRIHAIIPPMTKNPVLTIRKFQKNLISMDTLVGNGALTPYMARFLEAAVKAKLNIIISGSSGSGKTSLLNILSNYIPDEERILTIEDVRELQMHQRNVVSLEAKDENGLKPEDLVRRSLRLRPDRIVIGEVRGGEAYSLLQAMNTGHDGSITTLHANSPKDALNRLETMILMDGLEVPINALREYIGSAIDLIVHMSRLGDGRRKITAISEVKGVSKGELVLRDIFVFATEGMSENGTLLGNYTLLKGIPACLQKIERAGITDLNDIFKEKKKK